MKMKYLVALVLGLLAGAYISTAEPDCGCRPKCECIAKKGKCLCASANK